MPSPTAFGYDEVVNDARRQTWEHPGTGHVIDIRGGRFWDVAEVPPGSNQRSTVKTGMTREGATEYAGELARSSEPGGTPSDLDFS